jgi:hypothetical protein
MHNLLFFVIHKTCAVTIYNVLTLVALPYRWRQTLQDVDVTIPVPKGTRGKQLIVEIGRRSLKVAMKGSDAPMINVRSFF